MENTYNPFKGGVPLGDSVETMQRDFPLSSLNPLDFTNTTHSQGYYPSGQSHPAQQQQQHNHPIQQQFNQNQSFPYSMTSNGMSSHLSNNNFAHQEADSAEISSRAPNPSFNPMLHQQQGHLQQQHQQQQFYPSPTSYQPWQNSYQQNDQLFTVNPAQSQELSVENHLPLSAIPAETEDQVYKRFLDMCATIIQKSYRGYAMRKRHLGAIGQIDRFNSVLWAVIQGWRVRRIFRLKRLQDLISEIKPIIWKRRELIRSVKDSLPQVPPAQQSQFMYTKEKKVLRVALQSNQQYRFLSSELDAVQKELTTTINRLAVTGLWVFEDKHYKRSVSTIVSSFTVIDQSKRRPSRSPNNHVQQSQYPLRSGSQNYNQHYDPARSSQAQFATPVHSQVLSPQVQYNYPSSSQHLQHQQQQQQQQFQQQYPQQQQHQPFALQDQTIQLPVFQHYPSTTPPRISFSNYYPDAQRGESNVIDSSGAPPSAFPNHQLFSQQSGQFGVVNKDTSEVSRQLAFNNINPPEASQAPKQFVNSYQRSQTLIAETPEQALMRIDEKQPLEYQEEEEEEHVKASKPSEIAPGIKSGFNWDDVPVGGGKKKFAFEEFPNSGAQDHSTSSSGHVIKTDIKPTVPKSKRAAALAAAAAEESKKKNEAKIKPESKEDGESVKRSSGYRSQVDIPLVYTGTLPEQETESGVKKSSISDYSESGKQLSKEEQAEKDKQDRKTALNNLKKRTKYDPRKAIQNEKNGRENGEVEQEIVEDEEGNMSDQDKVSVDSKPRDKSSSAAKNSRKKREDNSMKEKDYSEAKEDKFVEKGERKSAKKQTLVQAENGNTMKKSTRGVQGHKLSWKNIESRVDCWSSWNKRSKLYEQTVLSSNTPKKRRINLSQSQNTLSQQQHQQQFMQTQQMQYSSSQQPQSTGIATSRSNEFSFVQGKLSSVSEAQQFQQKVRNKFGLNGGNSSTSIPSSNYERFQSSPRQAQANFAKQSNWLHSPVNENMKNQILEQQPASSLKLPNIDYNSLQNMTTGDLLKLREALVPIIQTNLIFVEQNDPKIFTKIAKEILKYNNN